MKIKIEAKKENLSRVISFCEDFLVSEFNPDYRNNLLLVAVEEIFANISSYAFGNKTGYAEIELLRTDENKIRVSFKDNGCPFNPLEFESDNHAKNNIDNLVPGGLGLYIVKNSMTNLKYEYNGDCNIFSFETAKEEKNEDNTI